MMGFNFDNLAPLRLATEPHLPGYVGRIKMHGYLGYMYWIITEDLDGHVELSCSLAPRGLPTDAQVLAFMRKLDPDGFGKAVETDPHRFQHRRCRHFVLAKTA
jgi:hypothetical protein